MAQENENIKNENTEGKQEKNEPVEAPVDFKFLIAEKIGMTQIYTKEGELKAVTVLKAGPCKVVYTRTRDLNGYNAVCLGFEHKTDKHVSKPLAGIFKKAEVKPMKHLKEFRVEKVNGFGAGQMVTVAKRFNDGDWLDVQGISIGKGFAGGMKRHNFRGGPASHGASDRERAPGGLASRRSLGKVLSGQRMAGHLGCEKITVHKIQIVKTMPEENLLLINGSVPGKEGSIVYITKTVKKVPKPVVAAPKSKAKKAAAKAPAKKKA